MTAKSPSRRPRKPPTPQLPIGPSPEALRAELASLLDAGTSEASDRFARRLAARQWRQWRAELAPLQVTAAEFRDLVVAYEREVWLWGIGNRSWEQMMEGLRGRALRRYR